MYRWDDESNGEIYTDRQNENSVMVQNDETSDESTIGLYVVENGKEYPLIPLRQRKSLFEANPRYVVHVQFTFGYIKSAVCLHF